MKWLSEQQCVNIMCDGRRWKHSERCPRISKCVVNKQYVAPSAIHSFILEIMAPYAWYQMLPQIYSITIAFHLSITNHAYGFVLGSHQQYLRHDKHRMNDRLSVVTSLKVNKGDI